MAGPTAATCRHRPGKTFRELYAGAKATGRQAMNAPLDRRSTAPRISRRGESLGTENAFVVLAEVNALVRQGRDIVSFCIGQPDFPTPANIQDAARRGDPRRQARLHAVGRHRRAARRRGARHGRATRTRHRARRCRRRRRRQAFHRLHHRVGDRLRRRRRSDLSGARAFPIYESQIVANGAVPVPIYLKESRDFAFDPHELEASRSRRRRGS